MIVAECLDEADKNTILQILAQKALELETYIDTYRKDIESMKGYNVEPDLTVLTNLEGDLVDSKRLIDAVHGLKVCR